MRRVAQQWHPLPPEKQKYKSFFKIIYLWFGLPNKIKTLLDTLHRHRSYSLSLNERVIYFQPQIVIPCYACMNLTNQSHITKFYNSVIGPWGALLTRT